jgi:tight adherence protein C
MVAALQMSLARAGMRSRQALAWALFARFAAPVAGALVALGLLYGLGKPALPGTLKPLAVVAVAVAAGFAPGVFVANRAQKRREAIRKQLADAFDLMVICAEAGLSLDAALDRVARETVQGAPELSDEIALTSIELSFLPDRQKALSGLADRVPLPAVRALINTLVQTERYGTPLAQALRVLAAELRDERMMRAEEKAARLPAVMTIPMVSFILPPLFLVLIGPAILRTIDGLRGLHH